MNNIDIGLKCLDCFRNSSLSQFESLALELRQELIESVTTIGGHFASSFGVLELTMVLHYVFITPQDEPIWDVGHQAYFHKLKRGILLREAQPAKNIPSVGVGCVKYNRIVGICEQHAVTLAAGLACSRMKSVVAIYSTFLQRGYDQLVHEVCIQKLPVIFAINCAGLVGPEGETHHGVFDLEYLKSLPNKTIVSPKDGEELSNMLHCGRGNCISSGLHNVSFYLSQNHKAIYPKTIKALNAKLIAKAKTT